MGGADAECYVHNCWEYVPNPYLTCGECLHKYKSSEELVEAELQQQERAFNYGWVTSVIKLPVDEIYACPLCAHDF